ncbi:hypothetical protein Ahy_A07g036900 isoform B [Arachis hypogaea]|uniref:Uncharacterized protein n=1 Tax=Arachis hypogaea TaxID=3818 RepID=A0A445CH98_ARAHY|nr:hypothetical protein Ahy_A07g036900 isoform B [Arachis hypogaea]
MRVLVDELAALRRISTVTIGAGWRPSNANPNIVYCFHKVLTNRLPVKAHNIRPAESTDSSELRSEPSQGRHADPQKGDKQPTCSTMAKSSGFSGKNLLEIGIGSETETYKRREHRLDQHTIDSEHPLIEVVFPTHLLAGFYTLKGLMSNVEDNKEQQQMDVNASNESSNMPSSQKQVEEAIKKKYGGMMPKKPPLISKDHERAYFDSADWALGKQGGEKPKGPLEALRPKLQGLMSNVEDNKEQQQMDVNASNESSNMPSSQKQEEAIKKKYGGMMPKKPPLISKDHERAYFDSADWALGKQGGEKPKGPLEELRPKLQPTQQQTRYRKSPYAPEGEDFKLRTYSDK